MFFNKLIRRFCSTTTKSSSHPSFYAAPTKLTFYYDTLSPHSWIAFEILMRYRPIWNLDLTLKPVSLGKLSEYNDNYSFINEIKACPNKKNHYVDDLMKMGEYYQVPIVIPESLFYLYGVIGSLHQQKYLVALRRKFPDKPGLIEEASRELWYRVWSEDMDARSVASLMIVSLRIGLSENEALEVINDSLESSVVNDELIANTKEADNNGAFSVPYFLIDKTSKDFETYYGADRFEIIAHKLGKEWKGPVPDPSQFEAKEKAPKHADIFLNIEDFDNVQKTQKK